MTLRYWKDAKYRKVGRLYPGNDNLIHIVYDGIGELGTMTIEQAENILAGIEPQTISPAGSSDLSIPGTGYKMTIPVDGRLHLAIASQVRNMIDKWPRKKSALWLPETGGTEILESIFTITSIDDGFRVSDINREWETNELAGLKLIPISGTNKEIVFKILSNTKNQMMIDFDDADNIHIVEWEGYIPKPNSPGWHYNYATKEVNLVNKVRMELVYIETYSSGYQTLLQNFGGNLVFPFSGSWPSFKKSYQGLNVNPAYPDYNTIIFTRNGNSENLKQHKTSGYVQLDYYTKVTPRLQKNSNIYLDIKSLIFYSGLAPTTNFVFGDKYRIYDPTRNDYLLDDNSLPILSEPYWRAVSGSEDSITTTAINWYWDGEGSVFLSPDPVVLSELTFDNEIRIDVQNGTDLRIRDYAPGARQLEHEGHWVDRGTVDITSQCREGINTITVSVKDNNSGMVGFVSPVYVKRKR